MEAKKNKIFINCEQAKHICDKSQYNESSWWERLRLNIRFVYCKITRSYVVRNQKLSNLVNNKKVDCLDKKAKTTLKNNFEQELKK